MLKSIVITIVQGIVTKRKRQILIIPVVIAAPVVIIAILIQRIIRTKRQLKMTS